MHTLQWLGGAGQPGSKTDAARVAARYVRVDAELNGWLFFDELEVLGQTQAGDAVTLPQDADFEGAFLLSGPQTGGIRPDQTHRRFTKAISKVRRGVTS